MNLFKDSTIGKRNLFEKLFFAKTEEELHNFITANPDIFKQDNWHVLGGNPSNFGVIENQQSNPIAALIEKITNSIDAILMRKCYENGIDPKSFDAPRTMSEAINRFYPDRNWDLQTYRRKQSEEIQIVADGTPKNTSVIIYDNGEGQNPNNFENSFLSLLQGNKSEIHFVQGKYNMGGSGGIVFCGKKSYQLIASKRYDGNGKFGYTLIREHPLTKEEEKTKKNTWYEFLKIDGEIPSFEIDNIDLGLHGRNFKTGSIIKLYSYQFPTGYSGFAQDLNQSINEYLFEPALPILTVEKKERYPNNNVLELDLYGLKRRLEKEEEYVSEYFSNEYNEEGIGETKVTCYVFAPRVKDKDINKTRELIRKRYFKNNMHILFSVNGQVHGHYTSEFISRSLKMNMIKDHLLIHVDCTKMEYNFRKKLFMASRDRLKNGDETKQLREFLRKKLTHKESRLQEIVKERKNAFSVDSSDTNDLLRSFTKSLPMNSDLLKLLDQTFKLEQYKNKPQKANKKSQKHQKEKEPFNPQRFPSFFNLKQKNDGEKEVASIPINGEKTLKFNTDVENHYFDRIEESGELKIALLNYKKSNPATGGNAPGIGEIEDVFNIDRRSPKEGTIKLGLNPKKSDAIDVGDMVQMKVTLEGAGKDFDHVFWVKISEKEQPKENTKKEDKLDQEQLGLPEFVLTYREKQDKVLSWEEVGSKTNQQVSFETVMIPEVEGDNLERIIINMDSQVLKNFKSKQKNVGENQLLVANRKYISSVYFHALFLYTITKKQKYTLNKEVEGKEESSDIGTYLQDLFTGYYSEFILNFGGMDELMQGIGD